LLFVDPGELRLPPSRESVDPFKLARQFAAYNGNVDRMPPIEVIVDRAGVMQIQNGVTRATRACQPGTKVPVVVQAPTRRDLSGRPKVRDQS